MAPGEKQEFNVQNAAAAFKLDPKRYSVVEDVLKESIKQKKPYYVRQVLERNGWMEELIYSLHVAPEIKNQLMDPLPVEGKREAIKVPKRWLRKRNADRLFGGKVIGTGLVTLGLLGTGVAALMQPGEKPDNGAARNLR